MNFKEIKDGIYYVGTNDFTTKLFEALWPLPLGISYNSYIVKGEKIALVDCVEISQSNKLANNVKSIIGVRHPDYLIINHMEPDHSGAINVLRTYFPDMKIVGNAITLDMVRGFYGIYDNLIEVSDNDTIDLGGKILRFRLTPMVHWPETMMTYIEEDRTLFSGDAFGCFGALNGGIVDADINTTPYFPEMYRYYSNIIGKYGKAVQRAFSKISDLEIEYICPAHGPVWYEEIDRVFSIYNRLSRYIGEPGVVVAYGSMYGNTAAMADAIAIRLSSNGIKDVKIYNVSYSHQSYILGDIFRYSGLVIGSPTYSGGLFPPIETLIAAIKNRGLCNRVVATFGSFSWGAQAVKTMNSMLENCRLLNLDNISSVESKHAPTPSTIAACYHLADRLSRNLVSEF